MKTLLMREYLTNKTPTAPKVYQNKNKLESSNMLNVLDRSKMIDERYKIKLNSSHIININEEVSYQGHSPISDLSHTQKGNISVSPSNSSNFVKKKTEVKAYSNFTTNILLKSNSFVNLHSSQRKESDKLIK